MNRVALITGASRGIGRGIALELARLGFDLLLNYRSAEEAAAETTQACLEAARSAGKSIRVERGRGDISNLGMHDELLSYARRSFARLDLLVNNAGVAPRER